MALGADRLAEGRDAATSSGVLATTDDLAPDRHAAPGRADAPEHNASCAAAGIDATPGLSLGFERSWACGP